MRCWPTRARHGHPGRGADSTGIGGQRSASGVRGRRCPSDGSQIHRAKGLNCAHMQCNACTHKHTRIYTCAHIHTHAHPCRHVCAHTCTHAQCKAHMHTSTHGRTHTRTCTLMHTHAYAHAHGYAHVYMHAHPCMHVAVGPKVLVWRHSLALVSLPEPPTSAPSRRGPASPGTPRRLAGISRPCLPTLPPLPLCPER